MLESENISQLKVLVVDDIPENVDLLVRILKIKFSLEPACAVDGQEAIDAVHSQGPFDIIFMDMMMPVMDGYTATKQLKKSEAPPVIVAVTAAVQQSDQEKCDDAGCDHFVSKPINIKSFCKLVEEIASALSGKSNAAPSMTSVGSHKVNA